MKLGDKQKSFSGSSQWIGSIEIGMVLQEMLNVQYRIQTILPNTSLSSLARQILIHFQTVNCPIMIGGNNLAHTIVGVVFDSDIGYCHYLVVDPHYTGQNNIKKMTSKVFIF